ncbi:MAG: hypothetical protein HC866_08895 [Leptolyngbyaceae cyanobacterium RU_5_1]|nr:hypothetical protein [Leptolyngbyaceae cyanobacterium RU_5_1]
MDQRPIHSDLDPHSAPPDLAEHSPAQDSVAFRRINQILQTRPFAFWSGVWVSVFLISVVALGSLLSPNAAERRSVSAIAVGSDSAVATQPVASRGRVPLWLFGAIALTCTAGSILVSRQLSQPPEPPRPVRQPRRRAAQRPRSLPKQSGHQPAAKPRSRPAAKQPHRQPKRLKPFSPTEAFLSATSPVPTGHPPQAARPAMYSATGSTPIPAATQPVHRVPVTIVPAEQRHPLDWGEARLADSVDLRRRRSLRSWM